MILPNVLMEQSSLTQKQLESLMSYVRVAAGEMHYREAAALRSEKPVTIGSYFRTVQQGRNQVRESIVTVLVAIAMGLVKGEDVRRLLELIAKGNTEVADEDRKRFALVLQTLLDRIVM
ncbi:MAG: hypothetical protein ABSB53_01400 [Nitrososphaerales archaeon]|jgi:hypothetical protein